MLAASIWAEPPADQLVDNDPPSSIRLTPTWPPEAATIRPTVWARGPKLGWVGSAAGAAVGVGVGSGVASTAGGAGVFEARLAATVCLGERSTAWTSAYMKLSEKARTPPTMSTSEPTRHISE